MGFFVFMSRPEISSLLNQKSSNSIGLKFVAGMDWKSSLSGARARCSRQLESYSCFIKSAMCSLYQVYVNKKC
jgi:hypothetical protein